MRQEWDNDKCQYECKKPKTHGTCEEIPEIPDKDNVPASVIRIAVLSLCMHQESCWWSTGYVWWDCKYTREWTKQP